MDTALSRIFGEHLHTETNTQQRLLPLYYFAAQNLYNPAALQILHRFAKRTNTREYVRARPAYIIRLAGDCVRVAEQRKRIRNRAHIAHPVINNENIFFMHT